MTTDKPTEEQAKALIEYARGGMPRGTVAGLLGITEARLDRWLEGDDELRTRSDAAHREFIAEQVDNIRRAAKTDPEAAAWLREHGYSLD